MLNVYEGTSNNFLSVIGISVNRGEMIVTVKSLPKSLDSEDDSC